LTYPAGKVADKGGFIMPLGLVLVVAMAWADVLEIAFSFHDFHVMVPEVRCTSCTLSLKTTINYNKLNNLKDSRL